MGIDLFRSGTVVGTATGAVAGLAIGLGISVAGSPPAAASPLPTFDGCGELLRWYVDRALPQVGPYGFGGGPMPYAGMEGDVDLDGGFAAQGSGSDSGSGDSSGSGSGDSSGSGAAPVAPVAPAARAADEGQTSSGSGTNVQETGVDEPDLAKTDGDLVVRVRGGRLLVTRVDGDEVGRVADVGAVGLPSDLQASELLLSGSRVLVVGSTPQVVPMGVVEPTWSVPPPVRDVPPEGWSEPGSEGDVLPELSPEPVPMPMPEPAPRTIMPPLPWHDVDTSRVVEVDLTDPASPRVLSDRTYGGRLVSARQYDAAGGAVIRLVLHTGAPTLDFVQPNRDRTPEEATEQNRRTVRESEISDWLPQVRSADDGSAGQQVVDCDEVRHPLTDDLPTLDPDSPTTDLGWSGPDLGTLSIVTLPFSDPTATSATAVTTSAETVYSSTDRLYLALNGPSGRTSVHAFALEGATTRYVASGSVEGMVRDRWSMDEHDGVLRMAVGLGGWSASDNGVVTLREEGDRLVILGSVTGLGPDEEIKSVRWFDDLAIVVTFRQTDPLYTVDLSDPGSPRTLGALKIPGFSTYLHPLGGGRLLGVGQDASPDGQTRGSQVSVFDVNELTSPRRLSRLPVDGAMLLAEHDPRALTWLPTDRVGGVVLAGITDWDGRSAVTELRVGTDGSLVRGRTWAVGSPYDGAAPRALPLGQGRVALVGTGVEVVEVATGDLG